MHIKELDIIDKDHNDPRLLVVALFICFITMAPLIYLINIFQEQENRSYFLHLIRKTIHQFFTYNWTWDALSAIGQIIGAIATVITAYMAYKTIQKNTEIAQLPFDSNLILNKQIDYDNEVVTVFATNNRNVPAQLIDVGLIICEVLSPSFSDVLQGKPSYKKITLPDINKPYVISNQKRSALALGENISIQFDYSFFYKYIQNADKKQKLVSFDVYFYFIDIQNKIFKHKIHISSYQGDFVSEFVIY